MPRPTRQACGAPPPSGDVPRSFKTSTPAFNYTRMESTIPMRDGVKLFTIVAIPRHRTGRLPIVLTRTPYGAARRAARTDIPDIAMVLPAADEALVRSGYIRVYQDVRGRFRSRGRLSQPTKISRATRDAVSDQTRAKEDVEGYGPGQRRQVTARPPNPGATMGDDTGHPPLYRRSGGELLPGTLGGLLMQRFQGGTVRQVAGGEQDLLDRGGAAGRRQADRRAVEGGGRSAAQQQHQYQMRREPASGRRSGWHQRRPIRPAASTR